MNKQTQLKGIEIVEDEAGFFYAYEVWRRCGALRDGEEDFFKVNCVLPRLHLESVVELATAKAKAAQTTLTNYPGMSDTVPLVQSYAKWSV